VYGQVDSMCRGWSSINPSIVITPERILYDGVSGIYLTGINLDNQDFHVNKARLDDVNVLADVLVGLLLIPLLQSLV